MHLFYFNNLKSIVFALLLGIVNVCEAETLLLFDFEDANGNFDLSAELAADGLDPKTWTVLSSSIRDFGGNPGRAMASSGFSAGNTFQLVVAINPGSVVELSGFAFDQLASSSGPSEWTLDINGTGIASGFTTTGFETENGSFGFEPLSDTFTIGLSGSGASSNRGTFRIDNFALTGTIQPVPLPASLGLFAVAGISLAACPRKRL